MRYMYTRKTKLRLERLNYRTYMKCRIPLAYYLLDNINLLLRGLMLKTTLSIGKPPKKFIFLVVRPRPFPPPPSA